MEKATGDRVGVSAALGEIATGEHASGDSSGTSTAVSTLGRNQARPLLVQPSHGPSSQRHRCVRAQRGCTSACHRILPFSCCFSYFGFFLFSGPESSVFQRRQKRADTWALMPSSTRRRGREGCTPGLGAERRY